MVDTSGYEKDLNNASKETNSFADKLKNGLGTAGKVAGGAMLAAGAAIAGATKYLVDGASQAAEYGDNIDKMSQKIGISAEAYQEWDFIMGHCGASVDGLQAGMKTLSNAAQNGKDSFEKLGISLEDATTMSQEDLFSAVVKGLQEMEAGTERTAIASELLGKSATELAPLFNTTAEETEAMRKQVHALGGVMSDEAVKDAAAFQDSLANVQTAFKGLANGMVTNFLPSMVRVMDGVAAIASGDNNGLTLLKQGIDDFVENLASTIPKMLETGISIVETLSGAIIENVPTLIASGVEILTQFVTTIIGQFPSVVETGAEVLITLVDGIANQLPDLIPVAVEAIATIAETLTNPDSMSKMIDSALNLILKLAEGLIKAIPRLIEAVPTIIENLVNNFTQNFPKIVTMAGELIGKLAVGLIQAIPSLLKAVPQIITALVNGFKAQMSNILNIGKNIVEGVWNGISSMVGEFTSRVKNFFSNIVSSVQSVLGIKSPSRVFANIGKMMTAGLDEGWEDNISGVKKMIDKDMSSLTHGATAQIDYNNSVGGKLNYGLSKLHASAMSGATIVVQSVLDGKVIGETATKYQNRKERAFA